MIFLSLDCASAHCSVCVWQDDGVRAQKSETMDRGQDARLIPLIQEVIADAAVGFADLDGIVAARGPGSFTGLRIGLATARGLGFAGAKPVFGVDRFAVHRFQQRDCTAALYVILESRRAELYVRVYPADGSLPEPTMLTPEEIRVLLVSDPAARIAGDAAAPLKGFVEGSRFLAATESEVVTMAALAAQADRDDPAFLPRPFYLRAPDVTIKSCEGACA